MKIVDGKAVFDSTEEEAAFRTLAEESTKGLKEKNAELLGKLKAFDPLKGIDPDEHRKLKEQAAKVEEERALKAGEFDNLKKQLVDAHAKEKAAWEAEKATLRQSLENNVLIATATQAIAAEKGSSILLMPHVRNRTKLDDSGNPVVVDDQGNVRIDAKGQPLTIPALIAEMKADVATFGRAFEASGASGGGTPPNTGTGNGAGKFDHLSPADRISAAREAGIKE
jgi:hypothetical protein